MHNFAGDNDIRRQAGRREFLRQAAWQGAAFGLSAFPAWGEPERENRGETIVVGVMGLSRGEALAVGFAQQPDVRIKYLCDVDRSRVEACIRRVAEIPGQRPLATTDFRRILDDPEVTALVCAAPNHWHGPATIMACDAGKHVYVEKPCCHNPREGEQMIAAARRNARCVQVGSQRRSSPGTIAAIGRLHDGVIGRPYLARGSYSANRGSIGIGKPAPVPAHLDYELWQGPAPRRPYLDNVVHYNWHWRWHWGNGELGNNGIHSIDLCRWGLGVDYPVRVTSSGGRYGFVDDQETPDTHTVCFEFPGRQSITWQGQSCHPHRMPFVTFVGERGAMELNERGGYTIFDEKDRVIEQIEATSMGDAEHIANFLAAIRQQAPHIANAGLETAHRSTLLCHLGNMAHRVGRSLGCDPASGRVVADDEAMNYWSREYAPGWEPARV